MFYLFLADGFEETEALATLDVMRRAKMDVITVGVTGMEVTGSHNVTVKADIGIDAVDISKADGAVLPGGMPGTLNLEKNQTVINCVKTCYEKGLPVCAICAAPSIFGHMGLLNGKTATCFPGFESELTGANHTGAAVETDGNVITARGAGCAIPFGHAIVSLALGRDAADRVTKDMQCL